MTSNKRVPVMSLVGTGGRCVGPTTLPPLCADWLEILGASTPLSPKGPSRPVQGQLYVFHENDSSQML